MGACLRMSDVTIGLYRHFKGGYYYVTGLSRRSEKYEVSVNYFDIIHPEVGSFNRPLDDFVARLDEKDGEVISIHDREDNVTGQYLRFERVKDLNFQLGSVSTEQLIDELRKRKDSPIHQLDLDGLSSDIAYTDYVIGEVYEDKVMNGKFLKGGVKTIASYESRKQAETAFDGVPHRKVASVFKRTFINVH